MDKLMKIMMGGWIPVDKRTQWTAFIVAVGVLLDGIVKWGTGAEGFTDFLKAIGDNWPALAGAFGFYFLGEKVDAKK